MILNDNSTQQINTLVIQLQNRITNLNNELKNLNKESSDLNSKISDLERRVSSNANDADDMNTEISDLERRISSNANAIAAMNNEISDLERRISSNANAVDAMNTEILANTEAISGKADKNHTHTKSQITDFAHNHDDRYFTETEVTNKLAGKSDTGHTHTKSQITDFPTSLPANGGKSAKSSFLDEYVGAGGTRPTSGNIIPKDATEYGGMRKDVVTSSMTDSGPGQDGHLLTMFWDNGGRYDSQFFVSNDNPLTLKVRVKTNTSDYGPWVDLITSRNIGGQTVARASTAGTADNARNMYHQNLDLSALDKTKFYPLVCCSANDFAEVAICSESALGSYEYNQNRIHFDISTMGWSDLRPTLNIREYGCYENNEITIGCIGRGIHNGAWAIWLRGGIHYTCFSRNADLSLKTSDYTFGDETYTVGTNYYGGSNTNVVVMFTPQSTITEGAYSTRPITAPNITSLEQRVAALESKA